MIKLYDMMDEFAHKVNEYISKPDATEKEKEIGAQVFDRIVSYLTYFDGEE